MFGTDERLAHKLRQHGRRAPAEVLEADHSGVGTTVGNPAFAGATEVVWKLKLGVRPEGKAAFPADVEARYPQYAGPAKGLMLSVLAEKMRAQFGGNPMFAGFGGPAAASADPIDQLEKLADLRDRGVLTADEFEAQKKRILGEDA